VAVEFCQANNIVVEAYCPLVRNQKADDPTLKSLSEKYKKSTGQVLIRYCLQKGWVSFPHDLFALRRTQTLTHLSQVPLPKSDTPSRIKENADIYDFEISKEDMTKLNDLDQGAEGAIVQAVDN
jgi:diketogulonate reductase-like aldo/keto reductase